MSTMNYFKEEDVIHIKIKDGPERNSVELSPNITAELDENNDIIGVEILNASSYLRDTILETVQAKLLQESESNRT
jgi:uncharacterized protein YuzE